MSLLAVFALATVGGVIGSMTITFVMTRVFVKKQLTKFWQWWNNR